MKTCIAILATAFVFCTAVANPRRIRTRCSACKGERSLSLTPPNLGQYDGELGVSPGKPFTSHRWDVKHARCPLCNGSGVHEMWQLEAPPPPDANDKEVCTKCEWSGIERCRHCDGTGIAQCPDCRKTGKGGVPGWLVVEASRATHASQGLYDNKCTSALQEEEVSAAYSPYTQTSKKKSYKSKPSDGTQSGGTQSGGKQTCAKQTCAKTKCCKKACCGKSCSSAPCGGRNDKGNCRTVTTYSSPIVTLGGNQPMASVSNNRPRRRADRTRKMVVIACTTCGGLGTIKCTYCDGMGGDYCKRCKGKGFKERKAARGS